jgi:hypothetical protein
MARYFLIDNHSGYIFADSADFEGAVWKSYANGIDEQFIEAARFAAEFDASIGEHGRVYEWIPDPRSDVTGYHVYVARSNTDPAIVDDGQDQEVIDSTLQYCDCIGFLRARPAQQPPLTDDELLDILLDRL